MIDVSIIVPVKDEAESIPILRKGIDQAMSHTQYVWECIWINDGSTDESLHVMKQFNSEDPTHHHYVELSRNYGKCSACGAGFKKSTGRIIATIDADLQNDPADIPRMLQVMETEKLGMVNGIRATRRDNIIRRVSSKVGNGFKNFISGGG